MGSLSAHDRLAARPTRAFFGPRGFTLVEVLVVIVVIAIASSLAVVAWRGDPRVDAGREARRFAGALEYAAQRAQWRRETLAVAADSRGWRFLQRADAANWTTIVDDEALVAHRLPAPLTIAPIRYAGQPVEPGSLIPLHASGRNDPSAFAIDGGDSRVIVAADPLNHVDIETLR